MTATAIIYRRFSTDEQGRDGRDSLARQSRVCEKFAEDRGWTISEAITDKGRSAYKGEHLLPEAELGKFISRLERGEIQQGSILVAEKLDRLSRRPVNEAMAWFYHLTNLGLQVAIADKNKVFGAKLSLEDFLGTSLSFATSNEESSKKSVNVVSAKRRLWDMAERREGKWTNLAGRPPLWLSRNQECDGWIVNEDRAKIVRNIYEWSANGLGAQAICRRLNEANEPPWGVWRKYEAKWGLTSINALLNNPAVEGDLVPDAGIFAGQSIRGFYNRIVDADLVARARSGKAERRKIRDQPARIGVFGLFSGLTVCGECGNRAFLTTHQKKGREYRYLRCEGARESRGCTNNGYYAYAAFEEAALDLLVDLALDDRFFEATGELRNLRIKKAETEKAIGDNRVRSDRARSGYNDTGVKGFLDDAAKIEAEIDELVSTLAEVEAAIVKASGKVGAIEHLRRVHDIRAAAKSDDRDTREEARAKLQRALGAIVNSVAIERTSVHDSIDQKVFTLSLVGMVMGVRIDTKGRVVADVSDALGKPLYEHLSPEDRTVLDPLIKRIQQRGKAIPDHLPGSTDQV